MNNNPINVFCITNAVIDVDRMMNKKPVQRNAGSGSSPLKIDGLIVTLMAHWLFNNWAP